MQPSPAESPLLVDPLQPRRFRHRQGWIAFLLCLACLAATLGAVGEAQEREIRRRLDTVREDYKTLLTSFVGYAIDRCNIHYPADTSVLWPEQPELPLTFATSPPGKYATQTLTSPIAYLDRLPIDPFRPGNTYGYFRVGDFPKYPFFAVLHSPGPDGVNQLDLKRFREQCMAILVEENPDHVVLPEHRLRIRRLADPFIYDPTNGLLSAGDLILLDDGTCQNTWGFAAEAMPSDTSRWGQADAETTTRTREPVPLTGSDETSGTTRVPSPMQKIMLDAGLLGARGGGIIQERLHSLQNHFGDFEFFGDPGPLSPIDRAALDRWRREDPRWWRVQRAFADPDADGAKLPDRAVATVDYDVVLIMHGKSQLLLAADEAREDPQAARARLGRLRRLLGPIAPPEDPTQVATLHERIPRELTRLARELEAAIAPAAGGNVR